MERYDNSHTDNSHVYTQTQPREKGPLICTVIARIRGFIWEKNGPQERAREKWMRGRGAGGVAYDQYKRVHSRTGDLTGLLQLLEH